MKILSWLILSVVLVLGFHLPALPNSLATAFYTADGNEIEVKMACEKGDSLFLLGSNEELIIASLSPLTYTVYQLDREILKTDQIRDFVATKNSKIYFATEKGLYFLEQPDRKPEILDETLPVENLRQVVKFESYLVLLYKDRVIVHNGTVWKDFDVPYREAVKEFKKALIGPDGSLWVLGEKGIFRVRGSDNMLYTKNKGFENTPIDIITDSEGNLYVLTEDFLWMNRGAKWRKIASVTSKGKLFIDQMDVPWIYESNKIYLYEMGSMVPIQFPELAAKEGILALFHNGIDHLYFLTSHHLLTTTNKPNSLSAVLEKKIQMYAPVLDVGFMEPFREDIFRVQSRLEDMNDTQQKDFLNKILFARLQRNYDPENLKFFYNAIRDWKDPNHYKSLLHKIEFDALQSDPEFSIYTQQKILKKVTRPEEIIREYYNLAELYDLMEQQEMAQAIYRQINHKFSVNTPELDWVLYSLVNHSPNNDNEEVYWQKLKSKKRNPIVQTYIKFHQYQDYTRNYYLKQVDSLVSYRFVDANNRFRSIWAAQTGAWMSSAKGRLYYIPADSVHLQPVRKPAGIVKIIQTVLGNIALLSNGRLEKVGVEGFERLEPYPSLSTRIQNIWSNAGIPVIKLKRQIVYFDEESGAWETIRIPREVYQFNFLNAVPYQENEWILIASTKIYKLAVPDASARGGPTEHIVEGLQVPSDVITIYDGARDNLGGIYLATNAGLYYFFEDKWKKIDRVEGFWGQKVFSVEYNKSSNSLIAMADSMAYLRLGESWISFEDPKKNLTPPVHQVALSDDGTAYILNADGIYIWYRHPADEIKIALQANNTAHYLWNYEKYDELTGYLNRLTSRNGLSNWAYEFLGRVNFQQQQYRYAYEQYRIGAMLQLNNPWITDSTFVALAHSLFEKGAWEYALQCGQFIVKNYPDSKLIPYLTEYFFQRATSGIFDRYLTERLKILNWLITIPGATVPRAEMIKYYHTLMMRYYWQSVEQNNPDVSWFRKSLEVVQDPAYTTVWNYYIAEYLINQQQYQQAMQALEGALQKVVNLKVRLALGRLWLQAYLHNLFKL